MKAGKVDTSPLVPLPNRGGEGDAANGIESRDRHGARHRHLGGGSVKGKSGQRKTESGTPKVEGRKRGGANIEQPTLNAEHRMGAMAEERPPKTVGGIVLPPEERFFTKPELAKVMKVSVRCVTDMMRRGEIRYLKINGHLVRFRLQDVNQRLSETVLFCGMPARGEWATANIQHSTANIEVKEAEVIGEPPMTAREPRALPGKPNASRLLAPR